MSFFQNVALGMVKAANQDSRQRAIRAREDELLRDEREANFSNMLYTGVINRTLDKSVLEQDLGTLMSRDKSSLGDYVIQPSQIPDIMNFMNPYLQDERVDPTQLANYLDTPGASLQGALSLIGPAPEEEGEDNSLEILKWGAELVKNKLIPQEKFDEVKLEFETTGKINQDSLFNAINVVSEEAKTHTVGGHTFPYLQPNFGEADEILNSVALLEIHLADPTVRKNIIAQATEDEGLKSYLNQIYTRNNVYYNSTSSKTDVEAGIVQNQYFQYDKDAPNFLEVLKGVGIIPNSQFKPAAFGNDTQASTGTVFIPDNEQPEEGGLVGISVPEQMIIDQYNVDSKMLDGLANHHDMEQGKDQLYTNLDYLTYSEAPEPNLDATAFVQSEDKMESVATGAKLIQVGAQNMFSLEGGATRGQVDATSSLLINVGGGTAENGYTNLDTGKMTRAVFTITKPDARQYGKPSSHLTGQTGTQYMLDRKFDVEGFREQSEAAKEANEMLAELIRLQEELGAPGIVAIVEKFALGFVGQGKQISNLFSIYGEQSDPTFSDKLARDQGTTSATLQEIAREKLGIGRDAKLSQAQALRLTLAAKMARAVDPSGRLSNQDFEIQLDRLGSSGLFNTEAGTMAKLGTVKKEFETRVKNNMFFESIISKDNITSEDTRFIKAHNLVKRAVLHQKMKGAQRRSDFGGKVDDGEGQASRGKPFKGIDGATFTFENKIIKVFNSDGEDITDSEEVKNLLTNTGS